MSLHKIHWFLGYNSLAIITEQERKHWLMKTDKKKQMIDPVTGDSFQGQIDNLGVDLIMETKGLPNNYNVLRKLSFTENLNAIFSLEPSAFPYSCAVNGFSFARITSINYPTNLDVDDIVTVETTTNGTNASMYLNEKTPDVKHFRLKFTDCETVILPFGGSDTTSDVFATRWIKTDHAYIELMDEKGSYTTAIPITFGENVRNLHIYYPLSESLQTLPLEYDNDGNYHTFGMTDNQYIGYPAFWFTCFDVINNGPYVNSFATSNNHRQLLCFGNEGNASKYMGKIYVGVDGDRDATPEDTPTSEVYITCSPRNDNVIFTNSDADFMLPISESSMKMGDKPFNLSYHGNKTRFYMTKNDHWEYVDETTYRINMCVFDQNCMSLGSNPLRSVFDIHFDESLSLFETSNTDLGTVGIRMSSGNPTSDMYQGYPYQLNEWNGLPEHMQHFGTDGIPEYMAIYAMHNPPTYVESVPDSRQTAALLFDLGAKQEKTYDFIVHYKDTTGEVPQGTGIPEYYLDFVRKLPKSKYETEDLPNVDNQTYLECLINTLHDNYARSNYHTPYEYYLIHPSHFDLDADDLSEEEFYEKVNDYMSQAMLYWIRHDDERNTKIDVLFGVTIRHINYALLKEHASNQLSTCYDENDNIVCLLYPPSYNDNGRIIGMTLTDFAVNAHLHLSDKIFHVVKVYGDAQVGSGVNEPIDLELQFDLELLDSVNDVGRIYVLSNDDATYVNNETTEYPKPDRTVARICDIPTSIVQLTGISGIAPVSVVDKKYVRSEVCYTEADQDRLYNTLGNRWVRPIHKRKIGVEKDCNNDYVFTSVIDLNNIDLMDRNDFRYVTNLNPTIDPKLIQAGVISSAGMGYEVGDIGYVYVGGFAFQYNVLKTSTNGGVTEFSISALKTGDSEDKQLPNINLSNFDFVDGEPSSTTKVYGTSPAKGNGEGFQCKLMIPDIEQYLPKKGDIYEDLFALVKQQDGLWIYGYNVDTSEWVKQTQIAEFESKDENSIYQTMSDAFMATLLPSRRSLYCSEYTNNKRPVDVDTLSTSSFINIIDQTKTPIQYDVTSDGSTASTKTEIDLCKFRCGDVNNGIQEYTLYKNLEKTWDNVRDTLAYHNALQSDCYVVWKWDDEADKNNVKFHAGVITRSFNNILSTDSFSMLPENKLKYQNNVNGNANTTIVWDVPKVGPMMWVFNPNSQVREKYHMDNERHAFYIEREQITWDTIDIYTSDKSKKESLFVTKNNTDVIDYNIYTNSPYVNGSDQHIQSDIIYDQPEFFKIVTRGTEKSKIPSTSNPTGNWVCVFPRVHGFVFENDTTKTRHIPIQLQSIHSNHIQSTSRILNDETGFDESTRTIVLEDTTDGGVRLRVFNNETSKWDII